VLGPQDHRGPPISEGLVFIIVIPWSILAGPESLVHARDPIPNIKVLDFLFWSMGKRNEEEE
jgi:hypothetical protein